MLWATLLLALGVSSPPVIVEPPEPPTIVAEEVVAPAPEESISGPSDSDFDRENAAADAFFDARDRGENPAPPPGVAETLEQAEAYGRTLEPPAF